MRQALNPQLPQPPQNMGDIMGMFQSLGDNCEFGLVQRWAEQEPLDLLRFAGFWIPLEDRLQKTIEALSDGFSGLGDPESVTLELAGETYPREFMLRESRWNLWQHTGAAEGSIDPDVLRRQQTRALQFKRRKLIEDMESAHRIFVWKSNLATAEPDVRDLVACLRRYGPNLLLWVSLADQHHPAGSIEYAGDGLLRGYVRRFAPYEAAGEIDHGPWHSVCRNAAAIADYLADCGEWSRREVRSQFRIDFGSPLGEVGLAEVGTAIDWDEREDHSCPAGLVILGGGFPADAATVFADNPGIQDIRSVRLRNVILHTQTAVWLRDNRKIRDTRYMVSEAEYPGVHPVLPGLRAQFADKVAVGGINRAFRSYYHWMMQTLPALNYGVRRVGADNAVLALYPLAPWEEETLDLLGLAQLPRLILDFHHHYYFAEAIYSEFLNGRTAFFLSPQSLAVIDKISAAVGPGGPGPERIYVARSDTANRPVTNEHEVQRALEAEGFTTVVPGSFSIRDQVGLFRHAQIVVGPHGAGMTNLAFCQPGTKVLELVPAHYPNACINRIAQARGLVYRAECFPSDVPNDGDVHRQPWSIDIGRMMETVHRLAH